MSDPTQAQPVQIVNDGEGLSVDEGAKLLEQTGLAENAVALDDAEQRRSHALPGSDVEAWEKAAKEHLGAVPGIQDKGPIPTEAAPATPRQQVPPQDGPAYQPPPPQAQPPQAPPPPQNEQEYAARMQQDPAFLHNELGRASQGAEAELVSIAQNRDALNAQHGPAAVTAHETQLRTQLSGMAQSRHQIEQAYQQQAAQQQRQAEVWIADQRRQMRSDLGVDQKEFEKLTLVARDIAIEQGATQQDLNQLSNPALARSLLIAAKERTDKAQLRKERDTAVRYAKRRKAAAAAPSKFDDQGMLKLSGGGTAHPQSLEAAAEHFRKLGF